MIDGSILIGARALHREPTFQGRNAATGEALPQNYSNANGEDVSAACALAAAASESFSTLAPAKRAAFLEAIADNILAVGDVLIETAMTETGLPRVRLEGERGRTMGQLKMFAAEVRDGHWLDVTIDPALPERTPLPRADLRRMNVALGPVAVFGASNFPLAFSVAGGDTASALAAGCPVVVKGHPAHPGTGELVARAIQKAVVDCGLHEGVFSYLPGTSHALGAALVADPHMTAVGFTGSRSGGLALMDTAAKRPVPIPVFAEMSSINPVVLMPAALTHRAEALGAAFIGSLTLGAGQFCTNPGLVIAQDGAGLERFIAAATAALASVSPAPMLTDGILSHYQAGVAALAAHKQVKQLGTSALGDGHTSGTAALFEVSAAQFIADAALAQEVFGAAGVIVRCRDTAEVLRVIAQLEGQLTATLHLDAADEPTAQPVVVALQVKAGRILINGWPTGVEVTHAMVHGGPYPATSNTGTTSVGTLAMARFVRPVCYQDMPDGLLPDALKAANPWALPRRVDGVWESAR